MCRSVATESSMWDRLQESANFGLIGNQSQGFVIGVTYEGCAGDK